MSFILFIVISGLYFLLLFRGASLYLMWMQGACEPQSLEVAALAGFAGTSFHRLSVSPMQTQIWFAPRLTDLVILLFVLLIFFEWLFAKIPSSSLVERPFGRKLPIFFIRCDKCFSLCRHLSAEEVFLFLILFFLLNDDHAELITVLDLGTVRFQGAAAIVLSV